MHSPISVNSEVGPLRQVLLHRPGHELENLVPAYLERQLFDDIPYLAHAALEHDAFAEQLRACGVEVLYLDDLVREAVDAAGAREAFVDEYLTDTGIRAPQTIAAIREYLLSLSTERMIAEMGGGIRKQSIKVNTRAHLEDFVDDAYPFYADPMPNLYFTRDPFACVGGGVILSRMANVVRCRETLFGDFIFRYHPVYAGIPRFHTPKDEPSIEGGDVHVLNDDTIVIGMSQRTTPYAAETVARRMLGEETGIRRVIAVDIPKVRAFMHLDTVMTMADRDTFIIHPNIASEMRFFILTMDGYKLKIEQDARPMRDVMRDALRVDKVRLIECGGGSVIDAAREQWNDGANTLCVRPGEVITYSRNYVTNRILRDEGITVYEIPSAELSRGRGGPRCMSMPFWRDPV